jgi:hypothetical protein
MSACVSSPSHNDEAASLGRAHVSVPCCNWIGRDMKHDFELRGICCLPAWSRRCLFSPAETKAGWNGWVRVEAAEVRAELTSRTSCFALRRAKNRFHDDAVMYPRVTDGRMNDGSTSTFRLTITSDPAKCIF